MAGPGARPEHQDDGAEAGGQRVAGHEVDDRLAVWSDRRQGLAAAVALGPSRGQDDQRRARPARRLRSRAPAEDGAGPRHAAAEARSGGGGRRRAPGRRSMASCRARGMEAEEVLP